MGIVTKKGDKGTTLTLGGEIISKADPSLGAVGTLDELTSALGLARSMCRHETLAQAIYKLQEDLTRIGAELSCGDNMPSAIEPTSTKQIQELEINITNLESQIKLPASLVIPGSNTSSASLDLARAIARRLEREVVALKKINNQKLIVYLNRLSDYLFLLARQAERLEGASENV